MEMGRSRIPQAMRLPARVAVAIALLIGLHVIGLHAEPAPGGATWKIGREEQQREEPEEDRTPREPRAGAALGPGGR